MKLSDAVKVAVRAMEAEMQKHAVNANLFDAYGLESGKAAYEYRKQLAEAIVTLQREVDHG